MHVARRPGRVGREDQVPLLDHHEEEQAVDEPQELLVVVTGREMAVDNGRAETVVVVVREETVTEVENRVLNRVAQPLADAGAESSESWWYCSIRLVAAVSFVSGKRVA